MERYQKIAGHSKFQYYMKMIEEKERERIFCHHNWDHLLAVARIAYIMVLEEQLHISKDLVYATAFLHDIGKAEQYTRGVPHEIESAVLAEGILKDCGYCAEEIRMIAGAILNHRVCKSSNTEFEKIIYRADKLSRPCKGCPAAAECNWPDEKKNLEVVI